MRIFQDTIDALDIVESGYNRPKISIENLEVDKPWDK